MNLKKSIGIFLILALLITGAVLYFSKNHSNAEKVHSQSVQQLPDETSGSESQINQESDGAKDEDGSNQNGTLTEEELVSAIFEKSGIVAKESLLLVKGTIKNEVGEIIEGADIAVSAAGYNIDRAVSNSEGYYQINIRAFEEFEVSATKEKYAEVRNLISSITSYSDSAEEVYEIEIDFTLSAPQDYSILIQNKELQPIEDAVVWIEKQIEKREGIYLKRIEKRSTDQDGMIILQNYPVNSQDTITVIHPDYAMQMSVLKPETVITLEKEGLNVDVMVTNQTKMQPAPSVSIEVEYLSALNGDESVLHKETQTTNSQGIFTLRGILPSQYRFTVKSDQYVMFSYEGDGDSIIKTIRDGNNPRQEIYICEGYEFSGLISDQNSNSLSEVRIKIDPDQVLAGHSSTVMSDDQGMYEFSGIKTRRTIAVFEKENYKTILAGKPVDHAKIQLWSGSSNTTKMQLFAPVTVQVVNSKDEPVPDIEVKYYTASDYGIEQEAVTSKTDSKGISNAIIPVSVEGMFKADAIYKGLTYSSDWIIWAPENFDAIHDIRVAESGTVFGKVTTEEGESVGNIVIECRRSSSYWLRTNSDIISQNTNEFGEFRFEGLPAGQGVLRIVSLDFEAEIQGFVLLPETEHEVNFVVTPFAELAGHVINSDQKPIADASITYKLHFGILTPIIKTDENGYFFIEKISTLDSSTLRVEPPTVYYQEKSQIEYTPNDLEMVIELEDQLPLVLIGTLIDDITNEPILDYKVRKDTNPPIDIEVVNGEFTEYVRGYQRGVYYQFSVNDDPYQRIWVRPSITDEQAKKGELRYEFVYQSSQTLEGIVIDQDTGSPLSGVTVGALTDPDVYGPFFDPFSPHRRISESDTAITGEDGRFRIVGNYPSPMAIRFDPPEGYKKTFIITPLKSGSTVLEDKVRLEKDHPIEILVINRHTNMPLANRKVSLTSRIEATGAREQITNAQGIARFSDLNLTTSLAYQVEVEGIDQVLYLSLRNLEGNQVVMDVGNATINLSATQNGKLVPIKGGLQQNRYGNIKNISPSSPKDSEVLVFSALPNGKYDARISYENGGVMYSKNIDIEVKDSGTIDQVIELANNTLRGIVRREDGKPHEISRITWSVNELSNTVPVNESGEFSMSGLEVGDVTVNAIRDQNEHVASETVSIVPEQSDYYLEMIIPSKGTGMLTASVTSGVTNRGVENLYASLTALDEN